MGLLDQVISGALGGQQAGGRSSPLMMALMALLANRNGGRGAGAGGLGGLLGSLGGGGLGGGTGGMGGGLGGLLEQFQRNGRGDTFNSWIGHGPNQPIAPDDLGQALGPDTVDHLSRETGMPRGDLLSELSRVMPGVVDRLTPNGRVPDRSEQDGW